MWHLKIKVLKKVYNKNCFPSLILRIKQSFTVFITLKNYLVNKSFAIIDISVNNFVKIYTKKIKTQI